MFEEYYDKYPHYRFCDEMVDAGWRSPDTYCSRDFGAFPERPGVYLISLVNIERNKYGIEDRVLYAGKSLNLRRRHTSHEVYSEIQPKLESRETSLQRWFKELHEDEIRESEIELIRKFHPPYNLVYRVKGLL